MNTVFWSPLRFSVVKILPKGQHFDAQYSIAAILSVIGENHPMQIWEDRSQKATLHFDNAGQTRLAPQLGT
jgi:hypothetical protein